MSVGSSIAVALASVVGIGGGYWYFKRKHKGLISQAVEIFKANGTIPSIPEIIHTLKSEAGDVHTNPDNKGGETHKEEPLKVPAPSSTPKKKKGKIKTKEVEENSK